LCFEKNITCGLHQKVWAERRQLLLNDGLQNPNQSTAPISEANTAIRIREIPLSPSAPDDNTLNQVQGNYIQYMREHANRNCNSSGGLLVSHLFHKYGPNLSKPICYAMAACACPLIYGIKSRYEEAITYRYLACRSIRLTSEVSEIGYGAFFLAQSCWIGNSILTANESIIEEMIQHLQGFTASLETLVGRGCHDEEIVIMKCSWYCVYAVLMRLLRRGRGRGCGHLSTSKLVEIFCRLDKLALSWFQLPVDERNIPFLLQRKYCLSQLKLAVYELQRTLDYYYAIREDHAYGQQLEMTKDVASTIPGKMHQVENLLSKVDQIETRFHSPTLIDPEDYDTTLRDAILAYKTFVVEYVLLVLPHTESPDHEFSDLAISVARDIIEFLENESRLPAFEEVEQRSMWLLFLASILLHRRGDHSSIIHIIPNLMITGRIQTFSLFQTLLARFSMPSRSLLLQFYETACQTSDMGIIIAENIGIYDCMHELPASWGPYQGDDRGNRESHYFGNVCIA
jgi:hypothetical protein